MSEVYLHDCERCGAHAELPPAGGTLDCTCGRDGRDYGGLTVTRVIDGEVVWHRTIAEIMGVAA